MDQNEELLQAVVRGTEMGKNTLEQLLPSVEDPSLRAEFQRQQKGYRALNQQAHTALAALGSEAKGLGRRENQLYVRHIVSDHRCYLFLGFLCHSFRSFLRSR